METILLFTDGSVSSRTKIGYGAYLVIEERALEEDLSELPISIRRFEKTSSTKLELETLIWALGEVGSANRTIRVHTDAQNTISLLERRSYLEQHKFYSRSHKLLKNHQLYRDFFRIIDSLDCTFEKVQGHRPTRLKSRIDQLFSRVDRASRNALRNDF
jgi:ribonuclease HI